MTIEGVVFAWLIVMSVLTILCVAVIGWWIGSDR